MLHSQSTLQRPRGTGPSIDRAERRHSVQGPSKKSRCGSSSRTDVYLTFGNKLIDWMEERTGGVYTSSLRGGCDCETCVRDSLTQGWRKRMCRCTIVDPTCFTPVACTYTRVRGCEPAVLKKGTRACGDPCFLSFPFFCFCVPSSMAMLIPLSCLWSAVDLRLPSVSTDAWRRVKERAKALVSIWGRVGGNRGGGTFLFVYAWEMTLIRSACKVRQRCARLRETF